MKESDWIEDISLMYVGRTQTLAPSSVYIGSDLDHPFQMIFRDNLLFYPHVHDPNFYVLGPNPMTMPKIMTTVDPKFGRQLLYIKLVDHVHMNLPKNPCAEDLSYSFTVCIRNSVCQKMGCRPAWDKLSSHERIVCEDREQLDQYETEFYKFNTLEQKEVSNTTGCLLPCQYRKYQTVDSLLLDRGYNPIIMFTWATKTVDVQTGELVYPFAKLSFS